MAKVAMPHLGESVTEGTIGRWLKQPGEPIEKYEPLVEVTTDKVNTEMPSPFAGVLGEITAQEGETVHVGDQIAVIVVAGEAPAKAQPAQVMNQGGGEAAGPEDALAPPEASAVASELAPPAGEEAWPQPAGTGPALAAPASAAGAAEDGGESKRRRFTPVVLRLAEQHDIPLETLARLPGSGLGGRVNKQDVLHYIETRGLAPQPAAPAPPSASPSPQPAAPAAKPTEPAPSAVPGEVVPLTPMRKAIAEHMVRSLATAPHAWTMVEIDVTALARYRTAHKDDFARREGFALSYLPFFIEAVVGALKEFPVLNASFTEGGIELKRAINIGVAVALENQQGLLVPVLKGADERNKVGLARALNDLVTRTRAGKLTPDDVQGGTFTVNNTGAFGSILSQPIINQPQAAILTMEAIVKRPVVITDPATETDMIAIRQMMNACISFDHRVLDGLTAGQFMASLKRRLEGFTGRDG
ncbi:MAG: dihydrolipoamide acetyltransferase family protein [Thermomicrobiales bacterium]